MFFIDTLKQIEKIVIFKQLNLYIEQKSVSQSLFLNAILYFF